MDRLILRRDASHGTQPAGVESPDEEVRHDALLGLLAELRDQAEDASHGTQPAGVESPDEEVRHDALLGLLAELRDQGKARHCDPYAARVAETKPIS